MNYKSKTRLIPGKSYRVEKPFRDKDGIEVMVGQILYDAQCTTWHDQSRHTQGWWNFKNEDRTHLTCVCSDWSAHYYLDTVSL